MTWPVLIFWAVIVMAALSKRPIIIYVFFCTAAFGALAVIPTNLAGGVSLLAQPMSALFLALWTLRREGAAQAAMSMALDVRKLGLLTAFVAIASASAFILPRLFEGQVSVYPLRADQPGIAVLAPSSSNVTQALYLVMSYVTAIVFAVLWRDLNLRRAILTAIYCGGAVLALSGLLDLATAGTEILAPFRTASYVFMLNDSILGAKRVIGFMTEASSYGGGCVLFASLTYFLRAGISQGRLSLLAPLVTASLVCMAALSTSSTALVGLALLFLCAGFNLMRRMIVERGRVPQRDFMLDAAVLYLGVAAIVCLWLFQRSILDTAYSFIDTLIFKKTETDSFVERTEWSSTALAAFGQTGGLGLGVGSARVSNWFVAVLTSTGFAGAGLMAAVLLQALTRASRGEGYSGRETNAGLKFCIAISLTMGGLAATTPDFGLMVGWMLGALAGLSRSASAERTARPAEFAFSTPEFSDRNRR